VRLPGDAVRLTIYNPKRAGSCIFEVAAWSERSIFAAARAALGTLDGDERVGLLIDAWYFLRAGDGSTIKEGRVCESEELLP